MSDGEGSEADAGTAGAGQGNEADDRRESRKLKRKAAAAAQRAEWKEREREKRRKKRQEGGCMGGGWRWKNFSKDGEEGGGNSAAKSPATAATPEEAEARREAARQARQAQKAAELADFRERAARGPTVIIDMEWEDEMTEKEVKSLTHQVTFCYGHNRSAPKPVQLVLSGLSASSAASERLRKMSGFESWPLTVLDGPYIEHFPKEKLVYLTADSEEVLQSFDPEKAYIVGGIVDHNRLKGVTLAKAEEQGIATAQLPLAGNIDMGTSSKVLTVNKMLEIIVDFQAVGNWKEVLQKGVPTRKHAAAATKSERRGAVGAAAAQDAAAVDEAAPGAAAGASAPEPTDAPATT